MRVEFSHQFVIARAVYKLPVSWSWRRYRNLHIATASDLPVIELSDDCGATSAVILGWPIDIKVQALLPPKIRLGHFQFSSFEQILQTLAGRWLAIDLVEEQVFADAMSSQSAIFNAEHQIVCSSTAMLPDHLQELNNKFIKTLNIAKSEHFYPFSLLPQLGARRLLPSHKYSFQTSKVCRYWWPDLNQWVDLTNAASLISKQVKSVISICLDHYPVRQGLSAGLDTRLMLACSKEQRKQIKFWTRAEKKKDSLIDQDVAIALSARFNLNHELIHANNKDLKDADEWLYRTGYCIGGGALKNRHLIDSIEQVYVALTGIGGETCRAFYWPSTSLPKRLSAPLLLRLAGLPELDEFIDAGHQYLSEIQHLPVYVQLGLFYLENRVAAYASPHKYGNENGIIFVYPLNQHETVNQMLICPQRLQITAALHRKVIQQCWPELLDLPHNMPLQSVPRIIKTIRRIMSRFKTEFYLWQLNRRYKTN